DLFKADANYILELAREELVHRAADPTGPAGHDGNAPFELVHHNRRASAGGAPAPRRPAARTPIVIGAPRPAGPQPRDGLRRALPSSRSCPLLSVVSPRRAAEYRAEHRPQLLGARRRT